MGLFLPYSYNSIVNKPAATSVLNKTAFSIQVSWTPLPSQVSNGKISGYKICHKLDASSKPCETTAYVGHDITSYTVKHLLPYTFYDFMISAGTVAGYGPSALLTARTMASGRKNIENFPLWGSTLI
jgi:hypothetical protein